MATRGETSGDNPRRGQSVTESPTLLQIPLCVTAGPPEEGDPSLHRPALVDPAHNLDWREDPKGARPKVRPRFSTQTIAEEAQGFQGGTDFYLPLIGQPRISKCAHGGHLCALSKEIPGYIFRPIMARDLWRECLCGRRGDRTDVCIERGYLREDTRSC